MPNMCAPWALAWAMVTLVKMTLPPKTRKPWKMLLPSMVLPLPIRVRLPPVLTVATTSTPPATSADPLPDAVVQLSPDGPWRRVDGAPGVDTPGLFYELMPQLYVYLPLEEDLDHGITWTLGADDVPIIEAYLQALLVYYRAATVDPIDLDDPGWDRWYSDGGTALRESLQVRRDRGEHVELKDSVVLRPNVAGDERTSSTALVTDCILDGAVFLRPDGTLARGDR